jgi:hypothetical protein
VDEADLAVVATEALAEAEVLEAAEVLGAAEDQGVEVLRPGIAYISVAAWIQCPPRATSCGDTTPYRISDIAAYMRAVVYRDRTHSLNCQCGGKQFLKRERHHDLFRQ